MSRVESAESRAGPGELIARLRDLHAGPLALPDVIRYGDAAVAGLEALLRGPSQAVPHARCLAADALGAIRSRASTAALVRALRDSTARRPDPISLEAEDVVVDRIAGHLSGRRDPEASDALLEALRSRPYPACARALGRLGDSRAIPSLVECLHDDGARPAAVEALRRFGREACVPLALTLIDARPSLSLEAPSRIDGRTAAARLLGELADAGVAPAATELALRAALEDRQRQVRLQAALALAGRGGISTKEAAKTLAAGLDEADWVRAEEIVQALVHFGAAAEDAVVALIPAIPSDDAGRRRRLRAAAVAGMLGAPSAVAPLAALAGAAERRLRLAAVTALSQIPAAAPKELERFLSDEVAMVRRRAVEALRDRGALAPDRAASLLADPDRRIRSLARASLLETGCAALPPIRRILRTFGRPSRGLRARIRLWWRAWEWMISARHAPSPTQTQRFSP